MNSDDIDHEAIQRVQRMLQDIASLPLSDQEESLHALANQEIPHMRIREIQAMKSAIEKDFCQDSPLIVSTIDLLEGHLALREMFPGNYIT